MVRTQIQLTEQQARRLRTQARERGLSLAEVIRRYVNKGLAEETPDRTALYDRAARVCIFAQPAGYERGFAIASGLRLTALRFSWRPIRPSRRIRRCPRSSATIRMHSRRSRCFAAARRC